MTLLLSRCESAVLHALGQKSLPPEVSVLEIVDRAGKWLCAHPWNWLNRTGQVSTIQNVEYVDLSSALPGIRQVVSCSHNGLWMEPTDADRGMELRSESAQADASPYTWWVSTQLSSLGVFTLNLELWRTPSTSVANAIRVSYRAGWQAPAANADSARIAVPEDWEGVFLEAVIAYAQGLEERDLAPVHARLDALRASSIFQGLIRQDGMLQTNFGQLRGGGAAAESGEFSNRWRFR